MEIDKDIVKIIDSALSINEDIEYDKYGLYYDSQGEIVQCKFPEDPNHFSRHGGKLIEVKLGQALRVRESYPGFDKGVWNRKEYICIVEKIENEYTEEGYKTVLLCKGICTFTGDSLKDVDTLYIAEDNYKVREIAVLTGDFLNSIISDAENLVREQQERVDRLKSMQQYV